jgi:hypothetical protein
MFVHGRSTNAVSRPDKHCLQEDATSMLVERYREYRTALSDTPAGPTVEYNWSNLPSRLNAIWMPYIQRCQQPIRFKAALAQIDGQRLPLLIEQIAASLQKENAEDKFLVLRSLHIAAEFVARLEKQACQLREGKFGHVIPNGTS